MGEYFRYQKLTTMNSYQSIELYYQQGGSDKVYNVQIIADAYGTYDVAFEYGRRGSTLQTGLKAQAVGLRDALKIYDKLVAEKTGKGYQIKSGGLATNGGIQVVKKKEDWGMLPMLLSPVDEDEVEYYLEHDDYALQEKFDGERRLIDRKPSEVKAINRKGQVTALVASLDFEFMQLNKKYFIIDGEIIGDQYYAFDMVEEMPFEKRYEKLQDLLKSKLQKKSAVHLVKTAYGFAEKTKLYEQLKNANKEGVVFRLRTGMYAEGRTDAALKFKFYETASFIVTAVNSQRSVQIAVKADKAILSVGNVTVSVNFPVPPVGAIIEVRYLYAYQGGSVYQPVYLGERTDLSEDDCSINQLKYKPNISLI